MGSDLKRGKGDPFSHRLRSRALGGHEKEAEGLLGRSETLQWYQQESGDPGPFTPTLDLLQDEVFAGGGRPWAEAPM